MGAMVDKLAEKIKFEDQEIARIQSDATANLAAAKRRKAILQQAQSKLVEQPELEALIGLLAEVGVKVE